MIAETIHNHNLSIGSLNNSSHSPTTHEKIHFTLSINHEMHQFAAVNRNPETFEKWSTQLKCVEDILKSAENYESTHRTLE